MPARDYDEEDEYEYGRNQPGQSTTGNMPAPAAATGRRRFHSTGGAEPLGPALFKLVKCLECGQQYNLKTGKPIGALHITLYTLVMAVLDSGPASSRLTSC